VRAGADIDAKVVIGPITAFAKGFLGLSGGPPGPGAVRDPGANVRFGFPTNETNSTFSLSFAPSNGSQVIRYDEKCVATAGLASLRVPCPKSFWHVHGERASERYHISNERVSMATPQRQSAVHGDGRDEEARRVL
jgi:hypothetical protein